MLFVSCQGRDKSLSILQAMKAYGKMESELHPLNSALDGWVVIFLNLWGKHPPYPLNKRLGGPQILHGRFGEQKNFLLQPAVRIAYHVFCSNILTF